MSDVTAVPLRPVSKFGIAVLWVGVLLLVLGAAAWAMTLSRVAQINLQVVQPGTGAFVLADDVVLIKYEGRLPDGTVFDSAEQAPLDAGSVVPGFSQGLQRMQVGGKYKLSIPAELGYGAEGATRPDGSVVIPPNTDIEFDVEVIDKRSRQEIEAMQQMMQSMGAGGPGGPGGPGAPPGGAPGGAPQAGPPTGP